MSKRRAVVAAASRPCVEVAHDREVAEQDQTNIAVNRTHSMLSSSSKSSPSCSTSIAPKKRPRVSTKSQPSQKTATPQPPSLAVQAKLMRLRASLNHPQKAESALKASTTRPKHVVMTSTALLAALMTFHADWEVGGLDPAHVDVEILREIIAEGLPPCDERWGSSGSLEEWWKGNGAVVVDMGRSGELDFERGVRERLGGALSGMEVGSLLQFEVEEYYARIEDWEEGRWRRYGS